MRKTTVALAAVLALTGVACGGGGEPEAGGTTSAPAPAPASDSPSPSAPATPSAEDVTVTPGAVFYRDDFKDKSKGWTEKDTAQVAYTVHDDYAQPLYSVNIKAARLHVFPHPEFRGVKPDQLEDYQVAAQLQTTLAFGHTDLFGLTCRDLDGQRYSLAFGYDSRRTGQIPWRIVKHGPDGDRTLGEGAAPAPGGSAFTAAASCVGGQDGGPATLVLSVNDTEVGRAQDSESPLTKGYGGVYGFSDDGKTTFNVLGFAVRAATAG